MAAESCCPVLDYHQYIESQINKTGPKRLSKELINLKSMVKAILELNNWRFGSVNKKDKKVPGGVRQEIRFIAPNGKTYISLNTACKGFLQICEDVAANPRPMKRSREDLSISGCGVNPGGGTTDHPMADCLIGLVDYRHLRLKTDRSSYVGDDICSICGDGGTLIMCDHCPSTFHPECLGYEDLPEGEWFCGSCSCSVCSSSEYNRCKEPLADETVLCCEQCDYKCHIKCLSRICSELSPSGKWFCSKECSKIFHDLRKLVGRLNSTAVRGLRWTVMRWSRESGGDEIYDKKTRQKYHPKLITASRLLLECFNPVIESRTKKDIIVDLLFNSENELDRLNFRGFYTMILEKGDQMISVATFRVHNKKVAEMPFIGTSHQYGQKGMCRLLVDELTKLLSRIGVEKLILPAIPGVLDMWIKKFKFTEITNSQLLELSQKPFVTFQGTTLCQKELQKSTNLRQLQKIKEESCFKDSVHDTGDTNLTFGQKLSLMHQG